MDNGRYGTKYQYCEMVTEKNLPIFLQLFHKIYSSIVVHMLKVMHSLYEPKFIIYVAVIFLFLLIFGLVLLRDLFYQLHFTYGKKSSFDIVHSRLLLVS